MIYFIRGGASVKIGFVENKSLIHDRIGSLQTGSPIVLNIIGIMDGDKKMEWEIHRQFASARYLGEWFHLTAEIADFIESYCRPFVTNIDRSNHLQARAGFVPQGLRKSAPKETRAVPARDDLLKDFIRDCLRPGISCGASTIYAALIGYCKRKDIPGDIPSIKALGDHLTRSGFERTKQGGLIAYRACLVITNSEAEPIDLMPEETGLRGYAGD